MKKRGGKTTTTIVAEKPVKANQELPFPYNYLPYFLYHLIIISEPSETGPKLCWLIDFFKGSTLFCCLYLVHTFNQWNNPTALVYTGIHGKVALRFHVRQILMRL